jgi:hypothetical protein
MAGAPLGNTNGAKENRLVTDCLRRVVVQDPERLRKACEKVLEDAKEGNLSSLTFIADRLDGKPQQSHDHSGNMTFDITEVLLGDLSDRSDS